jgi:Tfp pilus assembly protein PilX
MRQTYELLIKTPIRLLRGQEGVSILAIMFVMVVLTAIGYSMARMMATKQMSVPVTAQSSSAFYVAEGGINYAGKYLSDLVSWGSLTDQTKSLGNGSFTVSFSEYCAYGNCPELGTYMCVTATSTGTYQEGKRVLISRFCREQGYGCNP